MGDWTEVTEQVVSRLTTVLEQVADIDELLHEVEKEDFTQQQRKQISDCLADLDVYLKGGILSHF